MTLDKAIKHAEEVADRYKWFKENYLENKEYKESAEEHRQLAEWLKDYKRLLEQEPKTGHWILVSERLPKIVDVSIKQEVNDVLDNIRVDIEKAVLEIIDRYKAEIEGRNDGD